MGALTDFLLKGSRSKKVGPCVHRTSVRVNKTIQSWIPRPAKEGAGPCESLWEGPAGGWEWQRGGDVTTIPGAPQQDFPQIQRGRREGCEKRKRIGCAALFLTPHAKRQFGCGACNAQYHHCDIFFTRDSWTHQDLQFMSQMCKHAMR